MFDKYTDAVDQKKLSEWFSSIDFNRYTGAIGGRFTYMMTPTSIGTVFKVRDNLTLDEIDVTNYKDW